MTARHHGKRVRTDASHTLPSQPPGVGRSPRTGRDRLQRFLGIIRLLAGGQEWPAKRLSEAFEVTERTVLRDMKVLEEAGMATRPRPRGPGGYRLAGQLLWEHPQLSLVEAVTLLAVAGRAAGSILEPDTEQAIAWAAAVKVTALQPPDARQRLEELAHLLQSQAAAARIWLCSQSWLAVLVEALVNHRALRVSVSGESVTEPLILVPKVIEAADGRWVLRAYEVGGTEIPVLDLQQVAQLEFDSDGA